MVAGIKGTSVTVVAEAFRNGMSMGAQALPMLALMRTAFRQGPSGMDAFALRGVCAMCSL